MERLRISLKKNPAIEINRISIIDLKLVYVILANKKIKYPSGYSPVVYIGTTQNGIARVAPSAAYRAEEILYDHGINSLQVRIGYMSRSTRDQTTLAQTRARVAAGFQRPLRRYPPL
jgi:hypothetical protein